MNPDHPEGPRILFEGKFLRLIKEGRWEYVERVRANGAVMVIAVTPEKELILVEEYRYPLHSITIGLPAGISGDEGPESLENSARRELLEEAGYQARDMVHLCTGPSSPGLTTEMISFFMATGLTKISSGGGVDNEDITVHHVPLDTIDKWISDQLTQGKILDPKVYLGLHFLHR